jgi:hypothetical protein
MNRNRPEGLIRKEEKGEEEENGKHLCPTHSLFVTLTAGFSAYL